MFSFSQVLAFGLVAVSSIRALPFVQTSCSINFGTSVGPTHAFNVLDEGFYHIINVATNTLVYATDQNSHQVAVANEGQSPGRITWELKKADQGGFHIINVDIEESIYVGQTGLLYCSWVPPAETFAVEQAGSGEFIVKEVNSDEEWTAELGVVRLTPSHGQKEQKWRFIRL
ncbi:hypothetical protein MVEN_00294700 [Mycena venus]|uniref:Ricin B lectin domain-containing protein n=1 Tax=Mycena venus TaxID=2733690 RepID=A0A8H6Z2T7_9AGAR|nr:hypothetical protein MVEN_00294700 [Mycena venus]